MKINSNRKASICLITILMIIVALGTQAQKYPFKTLKEALNASKFNPEKKGASYFIATADSHTGVGKEGFPSVIVDEINAMKFSPAFLVVNGDLITSASLGFGQVPGKKQKLKALQEFRKFRKVLEKLKPQIPYKLTLGNHDTYPYEKDGVLFKQIFPEHSLYSSFNLDNIHVVLLNGAQSGDIDKKQLKWLENDIAKLSPTQTVIIFVHQAAIEKNIVRERGIGESIRQVFAKYKGNIWLIGGHRHYNSTKVLKLPKTNVVRVVITTCNEKCWGSEKPGYWIYCLKNGNVHSRIFRRLGKGYRLAKKPDYSKAKPIPIPFGKTQNRLWTMMVGNDDRQYLIKSKAGDVVTWWAYVRELIYKLPLSKTCNKATNLALLANLGKINIEKKNQVFLSFDGQNWQQQKVPKPANGVYMFAIPEKMRKNKDIYVKVIGVNSKCIVGGFALCR